MKDTVRQGWQKFCQAGVWAPMAWVFCAAHHGNLETYGTLAVPILYSSCGITLLVITIIWGMRPQTPSLNWLSWPIALVCVIATYLLYMPAPAPIVHMGQALGGICVSWMYLSWARLYRSLPIETCIRCFAWALIISSLAKICIDLIPPEAECIAVSCIALASPLLANRAHHQGLPAEEVKAVYTASNVHRLWKIACGIALFGALIGIINGIDADLSAPLTAEANIFLHLCEIVLGCVVLLRAVPRHREFDFFQIWRIILVFMATGLVIMPFLQGDARAVALSLVGVAQTIVVILLWLALMDIAHYSSLHPYAVFGAGWVLYALPLAAGYFFAQFIPMDAQGSSIAPVLSYALILMLMFIVDSYPAGIRRIFADLGPTIPANDRFPDLERNCQQVGKEHGLTPREIEVMELICKGRSKAYIAETLFVAENTVRSHSKHLYAKLNVHSKQELIDLVRPEAPRRNIR